jgi:hypothetical protein
MLILIPAARKRNREREAGELAVLIGVACPRFAATGQRLLQGVQCNLRLEIQSVPLSRRGEPRTLSNFPGPPHPTAHKK